MPSGEVSALFWALVGLSGGAAVTAYSISGAKARNLWVLALLLLIAALLFRFGVPSWTASFAAATVSVLWALYPMLTIAAVALIIEDRQPRQAHLPDDTGHKVAPPFAASPGEASRWTPDIPFQIGLGLYIKATTNPATQFRSVIEASYELADALARAKITAWGREHPGEGAHFQIDRGFWARTDMTVETNYAFSHSRSVAAYDIKLSKAEMALVWPPRKS